MRLLWLSEASIQQRTIPRKVLKPKKFFYLKHSRSSTRARKLKTTNWKIPASRRSSPTPPPWIWMRARSRGTWSRTSDRAWPSGAKPPRRTRMEYAWVAGTDELFRHNMTKIWRKIHFDEILIKFGEKCQKFENSENLVHEKNVESVDFVKSFPTSIWSQKTGVDTAENRTF
jgi:hypothetical protein